MVPQLKHSHQPPCPVCNATATSDIIQIQAVPVFSNVLRDSRESALKADRGDIDLVFCHECTHVYNAAFDARRVQYSPQYDTALDYSPTFQKYIHALARRLVRTYRLQAKDIIEIGCGQGAFLGLLAEMGPNRCIGFDPGYNPQRTDGADAPNPFTIVQDYYSEKYAAYRADFWALRQVLEHLKSPADFMAMVRRAAAGREDAVLFAEVPNAMFTLKEFGIWDLIYEHCSYFTALSLSRLLAGAGFKPLGLAEAFGGQYLCIEARPVTGIKQPVHVPRDQSREAVERVVGEFADNYRRTTSAWAGILDDARRSGTRAVVWGAGSKGVTFLNLMPCEGIIDYVIDINPHKQGLYIPGAGQQITSPDKLTDIRPQMVIVMNPMYMEEIHQMITRLPLGKEDDLRLVAVGQA